MILQSTAAFYFWMPAYDPLKCLDIIRDLNLPQIDGCDIYIDPNQCCQFLNGLTGSKQRFLQSFSCNTLHSDLLSYSFDKPFDEKKLIEVLTTIGKIKALIGTSDLVLHGDFFEKNAERNLSLIRDCLPDVRLHLEMMGSDKKFATHPVHMYKLLTIDSNIRITPDIAHLQDWEAEFGCEKIFYDDALAHRIEIVHVSHHTSHLEKNWYAENGYIGSSAAVHSLLQCAPEIFFKGKCISALRGKVMVLEGIIPPCDCAEEIIRNEIGLLEMI